MKIRDLKSILSGLPDDGAVNFFQGPQLIRLTCLEYDWGIDGSVSIWLAEKNEKKNDETRTPATAAV